MRPLELNRRPSLAVVVAEKIRGAIVSGELGLGEAVSEDKLAVTLGVSRTPVREALTSLQLQGLINIQPQRGSFVFHPTESDVAELCEFRVMTETRAMWLAHSRDRELTLQQLQMAEDAMEAAVAAGDDQASAQADAAFHDALFANCGNQFLVQAYGLISGRISAIRVLLLHPTAIRSRSIEEHCEITEAFGASNLIRAEAVLGAHIMKMRVGYSEAMRMGLVKGNASQRRSG
ncbi:DNA-binding GntR family transcriptional regulator [Skermanella aerolata]|uniref:GntR family transcriptional regulator n=1 Tax=Skermanella aerolata TaxID=393310 RepID=UPI003D1A2FA5